jgi:hypothetical protein
MDLEPPFTLRTGGMSARLRQSERLGTTTHSLWITGIMAPADYRSRRRSRDRKLTAGRYKPGQILRVHAL